MATKKILVAIMLILFCAKSHAQLQVPSLDIQFKGGLTQIVDMRDEYNNLYRYSGPHLFYELNWNLSQHFAAGIFLANSMSAKTEFIGEYGSGNTNYQSAHSLYGAKLRISTGRQPKFRVFTELSYGKFEIYMEKDTYRISSESNFVGWSVGMMVRLNSRLYVAIPQATLRWRADHFFFEVPGDFAIGKYPPIIELTGGLSYNLGKKK